MNQGWKIGLKNLGCLDFLKALKPPKSNFYGLKFFSLWNVLHIIFYFIF